MNKRAIVPNEVSALDAMALQLMTQAQVALEEGDRESAETLYGVATRVMAIFEDGVERSIPVKWTDGMGNMLPEWEFIDRLDAEYDAYEAARYGTHSMRRTKVAQIYKKTRSLRAVQLLLGHTRIDSTVRYLGVELEDALAIAEAIEILRNRSAFMGCPLLPFIS